MIVIAVNNMPTDLNHVQVKTQRGLKEVSEYLQRPIFKYSIPDCVYYYCIRGSTIYVTTREVTK